MGEVEGAVVRAARAAVVESAADRLAADPDWRVRLATVGRQAVLEELGNHLDFVATTVENDAVAAFEQYARWSSRVLSSRGLQPAMLAHCFGVLETALAARVAPEAAQAAGAILRAGAVASTETPVAEPDPAAHALAEVQRLYLAALGRGQRRAATEIALRALREGADLASIYLEVLQPSLYEVGRRWERNEITVADEHLITALVQFTMAQLYAAQQPVAPTRGAAVVTGVEGELHQIGAHMVADLLEHDGWDVRFLGSNLPADAIVAAVRDQGAALVGVSVTMLVNLPRAQSLLQALRSAGGPALRVMVGGAAFRYVPDAWRGLGADALGLDGLDAVQVARRLAAA